MCASKIIETSFAPSPIERQIYFFYFLARATTSAFYLGETLQQITELALNPKLKNFSDMVSFSSAYINVCPSIIIANLS